MTIQLIDAFGTICGHATVEWETVANPETLKQEIEAIFPGPVQVALPTANPALAWQIRVFP